MYTAAQLLDCDVFMRVGPVCHDGPESANYWHVFGGHLLDWLRQEVLSGRIDEPEPAKYGASTLLSAVDNGDWELDPAPRAPGSWAPLGGEELLFDWAAHGMMDGWSPAVVVDAMSSFLRYLGQVGAVDPKHVEATAADLEAWAPRFISELA